MYAVAKRRKCITIDMKIQELYVDVYMWQWRMMRRQREGLGGSSEQRETNKSHKGSKLRN